MSAHRPTFARLGLALGAAVTALAAVAACGTATGVPAAQSRPSRPSGQGTGSPSLIDEVPAGDPLPTPSTTIRHGVCLSVMRPVSPATPGATRPRGLPSSLVSVDPNPIGVVAIWRPGMNARPCEPRLATAAAAEARRLAHDIRSAPAFPPLGVSCPMDDGAAVDLYFRYGDHHAVEHVTVALNGCVEVTAPTAWPRRATPALLHDLGALTPRPWHLVQPIR